ncbi:MAG: HAMP domain-containing protein [Proteobacteria bacterium]|nr:HAMP domain-containing protein [Pseudomonadota bacterium]
MKQDKLISQTSMKHGITFKMSLICGTVVLIFLAVSNAVFLNLESNLVNSIISENEKEAENAIDKEGVVQKELLDERLKATTEICAFISAPFLYNLDEKPLVTTLGAYMKLSEIQAIEVIDYNKEPFFAYWKNPQATSGKALPKNLKLNRDLFAESDALYSGEKVGSVRIYMTDEILMERLKKNKEEAKKQVAQFRSSTASKLNKAIVVQALIVVFVVSALLAVLIYSMKIIAVTPIKQMIERVKDMAQGEGDLTVRLNVTSKDEMSELAGWLNVFVANLQAMIKQVSGNSESLNVSSDHLSKLSRQMSGDAGNMSEKADVVASSGVEMSSNMVSVASAMEEVSINMNMVATAAEQMTSTIDEIAKNSEKARSVTVDAVSRAQGTSAKVDDLGQAAQKIGKVTEVITEISEQTNLLALNATIEAARAGEAGKGFAVVANEIKALAMQTAQATREIKDNITGIQESTSGTVSEIAQILKTINHVNDIVSTIATAVEEQSATAREIASNVNQASLGLNEVNTNVAHSSQVSSGISNDMADVNKAASNISHSSSQIDQQLNDLHHLSEELKNMVRQFKV